MEHHSDEYSQSHVAGSPKIGWYTILAMQSLLISVNVTVISIGRMHLLDNTVESRDYTPPFVRASIGQKWGGGLYAGSLHFHYRPLNITWARNLCTFSGYLMGNTQEDPK